MGDFTDNTNAAICYVEKISSDISSVLSFSQWPKASGHSKKVPSRIAYTEEQNSGTAPESWGFMDMNTSSTTTICYRFKLLVGQPQLLVHDDPTVGSVGHYLGRLPPETGPELVL